MSHRVMRWCLFLGLLVGLSGCGSARHQEALYRATYQHVYAQPVEQVWPEVVRLVTAQGYGVRKSGSQFILVTEWRNDTAMSRVVSSSSRLYAEGFRVDNGSCAVRIFRETVFTGNKGAMTPRDSMFTDSLTVGTAGDLNPAAEDGISRVQYVGNAQDRTPLTSGPVQMNRSVSRDGELEWKLLQYLDENAALGIQAELAQKERK
ncbi:hypothetical protein [Hyalangium versicolor]|uniref:hypothetical protein n=1 Tax=Hyalangium versicolor TaxID=2861190 RepID=UPI001CCF2132|nr:hypothetical protein [Hyalangium versicolor]